MLSIGYNSAILPLEYIEEESIVNSANHAGKCEVLVSAQAQAETDYLETLTQDIAGNTEGVSFTIPSEDDSYSQVVAVVLRDRQASTSYIQRRLGIGYNRAASLIERMEKEGIISPANYVSKREVLVSAEEERF
ncbi:hypothetical protein GCM10023261_08640 [Bartonella jaculi]|uniref:FtsK gamma domain-containing protein n=1 Tax=Bartonella jaculi TaxID=686226 RepID=A0ABP9N7E1_9HYPH